MADYRVLIINGGGVRGIIPAKIINEIVKVADKPIHELFDCIIGTSIGGIIAAALTVKGEDNKPLYNSDKIIKLFLEESEKIFPPNDHTKSNIFSAKYSREGLETVLDNYLGNSTFTNTTIPVVMISYSLDLDGPRVWSSLKAEHSKNYDLLLKDGAGATSAAPTYFPPKITTKSASHTFHDIDGGIFANSPSFVGITEILNHHNKIYKGKLLNFDVNKFIVVSIGTGKFTSTPLLAEYTENDSGWFINSIISGAIGLTTTILGLAIKGLVDCCYKVPVVGWTTGIATVSVISTAASYSYIQSLNFGTGGLGWIIKGGLIDRMMQGTEVSDTISATHVFKAIRINPDFTKADDNKFRELDKADQKHMKQFADRMDRFLHERGTQDLITDLIKCLTSKDSNDVACQEARVISQDLFGSQFYYKTNQDFLYADIENSDLIGKNFENSV